MKTRHTLNSLMLVILILALVGCNTLDRNKWYVFDDNKARFYDPAKRKFVIRGAKNTDFYFTLDTNYYTIQDGNRNRYILPPEVIEHARTAKDSRPAKDDPEGNWGPESNGLQLSIRFPKQSFAPGDPVLAEITLRNVGDEIVGYHILVTDVDLSFVAFHNDQRLPGGGYDLKSIFSTGRWPYRGISLAGHGMASFPGTQQKQYIDLNKFFEFGTEGVYEISAIRQIPSQKTTNEVRSGRAKIQFTIPQ